MKALSRVDVLEVDDRRLVRVEVPEWGGWLWVRAMTGDQRDAFELQSARRRAQSLEAGGDKLAAMDGIRARLVAAAACDEAGSPLFTAADVVALGKKNGEALDRVFTAARQLNGMGDEEVEELGKASATSSPNAGLGSGSPSPTESP